LSDIRTSIERDRGILKTIQLFVPGFRGYRIREDIRDSDMLLRHQIASALEKAERELEGLRRSLLSEGKVSDLERIGDVINLMNKTEGKVKHGEHGYSGLSYRLRVHEEELDRLYDIDMQLIDAVRSLEAAIHEGLSERTCSDLEYLLIGMEDLMESRIPLITESRGV
jgi:hypothetical protein